MYTLKLQTADLPLVIKQATIMTLSKPYSLSLQLKLKRGNVLYSITVFFCCLFVCLFIMILSITFLGGSIFHGLTYFLIVRSSHLKVDILVE